MFKRKDLLFLEGCVGDRKVIPEIICRYFSGSAISGEIAPYVLCLSLENLRAETFYVHTYILRLTPEEVLCEAFPGLLSAYFSVLERSRRLVRQKKQHVGTDESLQESAARAMHLVLRNLRCLDLASQMRIHRFFCFYDPGAVFRDVFLRLKESCSALQTGCFF